MKYKGSCHCGALQFEFESETIKNAIQCNCSICKKSGFLHLIVPISAFKLLTGENKLETYTFNSGIAKHTFCQTCGIKPFYTPRSNPDGIDINVRCLDVQPNAVSIVSFDGENWEQNAHKLAHKSKEK